MKMEVMYGTLYKVQSRANVLNYGSLSTKQPLILGLFLREMVKYLSC